MTAICFQYAAAIVFMLLRVSHPSISEKNYFVTVCMVVEAGVQFMSNFMGHVRTRANISSLCVTLPLGGVQSIVMSMSACLFVCPLA